MNTQTKPSITRREGKRLRWARNILRHWQLGCRDYETEFAIGDEIHAKRYERAVALIVAHKLSQ